MSQQKLDELSNLLTEFNSVRLNEILTEEEMQTLTASQTVSKIYRHLRNLLEEPEDKELRVYKPESRYKRAHGKTWILGGLSNFKDIND